MRDGPADHLDIEGQVALEAQLEEVEDPDAFFDAQG